MKESNWRSVKGRRKKGSGWEKKSAEGGFGYGNGIFVVGV